MSINFRTKVLVLALASIFVLVAAANAQPKRKNIDLLSADELAAYEHAIQILKDRSAANPFDRTGYLWQAWVHNCPFIRQPVAGPLTHAEKCDPVFTAPNPNFTGMS